MRQTGQISLHAAIWIDFAVALALLPLSLDIVAALGAIEALPRYWKAIVPAPPLWAFLRWSSSLSPLDHCIVRGNRKHRGSRINPVRREYGRESFDTAGTDDWRHRPPRELTNSSSTSPEATPQNQQCSGRTFGPVIRAPGLRTRSAARHR